MLTYFCIKLSETFYFGKQNVFLKLTDKMIMICCSEKAKGSQQTGFYLEFLFWGKSILKNFFEPSRGVRGHAPRKILKI